ncbi:MAG TPA: ATP-grasp domain-containing protein [Mucilaginibacter sp.]|jgi:predicted ATP-grasp superfamily ATP-dependent carboligase|nr:ATP-grasp domain-containing protein [Mucilaginibacter sp.]
MIPEKINQINSKVNNWGYFITELIRLKIARKEKMKILFSVKPAWEKRIRSGFGFTHHEIDFNEFTPENIKKSDLVVPLTISDLIVLNKDRSLIENNVIPIPVLDTIQLCGDKYQFYLTLKEKGFEYLLPEVGRNLPYPYILKRKSSEQGYDCYLILDAEKEKQYKDLIDSDDFFHQKVIESIHEYATHILFKNDEIQASVTLKYTWSSNTAINGQEEFISRKIVKCPHLELFSAILKSIDFQGLCCIDYKVVDGKPYIFEINPRFGGSLSMFFFAFIRHLDKKGTSIVSPAMSEMAGNVKI